MNKSIIKHSKPQNIVDLKSIFKSPKFSDPRLADLTAELNKVRFECKKTKVEIKLLENQILSPVNVINSERATEFKSRVKEAENIIKTIKEEKQFLSSEVDSIRETEDAERDESVEEIKSNSEKNQQILNETKEEKITLYDLEKEDRILTEKLRFVTDLDFKSELRKNSATMPVVASQQQIESEINEIFSEVKELMEKRNKAEHERRTILKGVESEVGTLEEKNEEFTNKLREIDSVLIKLYNSKIKKQKPKKVDFSNEIHPEISSEKANEFLIKSSKTSSAYTYVPKNDKNNFSPVQQQPSESILLEKRKIYDLFMVSPFEESDVTNNIIISDELLGNKVNTQSITITFDKQILYGFYVDYLNEHKCKVNGYKITSRIKPKETTIKMISLDGEKNEVINYIHVGVNEKEEIKYFHIVTSEAKELKWGSLDNCIKNEQKNIRKYESIIFKGKLNQMADKDAPNYYFLSGIGVVITYLSPK